MSVIPRDPFVYDERPGQQRPRETTLRDLLTILFRRKGIILAVVLVAGVLTLGRSLTSPTMYVASTQILLQGAQRSNALDTRPVFRPFEEVMSSELSIAVSEPVVSRARELLAERRSTPERPIQPAQVPINIRNLEASAQGASNVLLVRYSSSSVDDARDVVTAVTDAYLEVHRRLFELPDARNVIRETLRATEAELVQLEEERQEFLVTEGLYAGDQEKSQLVTTLEEQESQLLTLRSQIAGQEARIRGIRAALLNGNPEAVPLISDEGITPSRQSLIRLTEELVKLRAERGQLLARYSEGHRNVLALDDAITAMRSELGQGVENELREAEASLAVLQAKASAIETGMGQLENRLAKMPEMERRLDEYDRRIGALSDHYRDFKRGEYSLTLSEVTGRDFEAILLSPAGVPEAKSPRDPVRLSLGPVLGLLAGVALALFLERMDHAIHTAQDVEESLDLPVLASVSDSPWKPRTGFQRLAGRLRAFFGQG